MAPSLTVASLLRERSADSHPGLLFEDSAWSWAEFVEECSRRSHLLLRLRRPDRPFHVGVLLDNTPEYMFWIGAAALAGAAVVGVNSTRRGEELGADVRHTDCDLLVTDSENLLLVDGLELGIDRERWLLTDSAGYLAEVQAQPSSPPDVAAADDPATLLLLLFTSGSTGAPKAVICSTGRLATIAVTNAYGITRDDVNYNAMPLFHGNAIMACWAQALSTGATFALRRRFSASGFLPDIQRFGATFFNYVGRSLAYVLACPESPAERDNRLRFGFGTEASLRDRAEFERRFGCPLVENYGSSEGAISIKRTPQTPESALGLPPASMDVAIIDPITDEECPRARFADNGRLLNADEATGEIVNRSGAESFEGYYRNPGAAAERLRGGWFCSGDLGYRDEQGFFYFAGRSSDWMRVDSENFAAAPLERILSRFPGVGLVAVYPVPDSHTGDQVMATLQVDDGVDFDPTTWHEFLAAQPDLGTKWAPRFVRVTRDVPVTATRKIDKTRLRKQAWITGDEVWWRPDPKGEYRLMLDEDLATLEGQFYRNERQAALPAG